MDAPLSRLDVAVQDVEKDIRSLSESYQSVKECTTIPPPEKTDLNQTIWELSSLFQKINRLIHKLTKRSELYEKAIQNDCYARSMLLENQGTELQHVIQYGRNKIKQQLSQDQIYHEVIKRQIGEFYLKAYNLNMQLSANTNPRIEVAKRLLKLKTLYLTIHRKCAKLSSDCELVSTKLDQVSSSISNSISSLQSRMNRIMNQGRSNLTRR